MKRQIFWLALSYLLIVSLGYNIAIAQQPIAQQAYSVIEKHCLGCHGEFGTFTEDLIITYPTLISSGLVIPGNPTGSEFYQRLLGPTDNGPRMPLGQPLSADLIATVRKWIEMGAPDWNNIPPPDKSFISTDTILDTISTHLNTLPTFNRSYVRYFTMTHLYNAGTTPDVLQVYQEALSKLVNSLSWGRTVVNPTPIDEAETIFYIDLRHYEWDVRSDAWTRIEQTYPYKQPFEAETEAEQRQKLTNLQQEMDCEVPFVQADWFLAAASLPPLYHDILALPDTDTALEKQLEVDVAGNLQTAPGIRVWRAGFNDSGVSNNNRVVERHTSRYGAYWKSYDFAGSVGTQDIFTHPITFRQDGGEVVFNLPNGLQAYYISDASGNRLDDAPIAIVSNPAASDPVVRNGLSCFGCHTEGMKTFTDQVRAVIEDEVNPNFNKTQALALYPEKDVMDRLIEQDKQVYKTALEKTGGRIGGIEPIHRFYEVFLSPLDAAQAAAAVGLQTDAFREQINKKNSLQDLGLLVLTQENGTIKRDKWTDVFAQVLTVLPEDVSEPIPPDPIDDDRQDYVHIPDINLRAAIETALNKPQGTPITINDMQTLRTFVAENKGIQNLTGLQFATQVTLLKLGNNAITDVSPLAELTQLGSIHLWGNRIADMTPLANLINAHWLGLGDNAITDITPLKNLIKLTGLDIGKNPISDVSPLADLISLTDLFAENIQVTDLSMLARIPRLKRLSLGNNKSITQLPNLTGIKTLTRLDIINTSIKDISALSTFTQLKTLDLYGNLIEDITPIAPLVNLTRLHLSDNIIEDISPLSELTQLKKLYLHSNIISDVTSLAGLTNLEHLHLNNNVITDFSPLEALAKTISDFRTEGNPGSTTIGIGGPKIVGPWLWMIVPTRDTESADAARRNIDYLAQVSGGVVTELGIATHGAIEGDPVGDKVWTLSKISPTDGNNINTLANATGLGAGDINRHVAYGSILLHAPREQQTKMLVGSDDAVKVRINGQMVHKNAVNRGSSGYQDEFDVTLKEGTNVLLVAVYEGVGSWSGFFGFAPDADYTVLSYRNRFFLETETTQLNVDETFTLHLNGTEVDDLAGWQADIAYDPAVLKAQKVTEGSFLKQNRGRTYFRKGTIDNEIGRITGISSARTTTGGVDGEGRLLSITFETIAIGESRVELRNFHGGTSIGENIFSVPPKTTIIVKDSTIDPPIIGFTLSTNTTTIAVDDTFTLNLNANNINNLAGWSADITFDPKVLEAEKVDEGEFLKSDGGTTFFVAGAINNTTGKIIGLNTARIGGIGSSGTGTLMTITFHAKANGTTNIAFTNFQAGTNAGDAIPSDPLNLTITIGEDDMNSGEEDNTLLAADVNKDGSVSILDLIIVAGYLGRDASTYPRADVNGDNIISILDLILVANSIGTTESSAPAFLTADTDTLTPTIISAWIEHAQTQNDGSHAFKVGIANLYKLLESVIPNQTSLLPNYPNPFNPETWIPYQLAKSTDVALTIYSADGKVIRTLELGVKSAGIYQDRNRAAYWDGKNDIGESVASGVYLYTLTAGEFIATRKMLIMK